MSLRLDARPFSPRPPPLVAQPCSVASSIVWACPTPPACSSSATPFGFPLRPQIAFDRGEAGGLPDSSNVCPHMHGVSDPGWPQPVSHNDVLNVAFRLPRRRRHHRLEGFRGSTPSLCVPLSTLRPQPHDRRRMTRGRGGLLSLPRMALSSTTLCLLTGALRGSITRPAHSLSTLRHRSYLRPRKTRF